METIIELILKWAVPATCGGLLAIAKSALNTYKSHLEESKAAEKEKRRLERANADGTKILLKRELRVIYQEYVRGESNCIPRQIYEDAEEIYAAYKALNGNHFGDVMWKAIKELSICDL